MNKFLTLICCLLVANISFAQPWLDGVDMSRPVKLQDIIDRYERSKVPLAYEEEDRPVEGKDHHFDRWVWYMQHNLDENGYIISPMKKYEEWKKLEVKKAVRAYAKSTANGVDESQWVFQGPTESPSGYYGVGRINKVCFHPTDSNQYWVCSGGGGAWKTTDDGATWSNMTNDLPVLGTSDVVINHKNPNTIYLCTGDRDASDTYSIGVLKSTDGGMTWNQTGLQWNVTQNRLANSLVMNSIDTNSLTLAASNGIYKSYNGGQTWTNKLSGNFKQILYSVNDTNVLVATGQGSFGGVQIYRSADGGENWTKVTAISDTRRIAVANTIAAPNVYKAVVANQAAGLEGIYTSIDGGINWIKTMDDSSCTQNILNGSNGNLSTTTCGGQGWYDLAIAISPLDANRLYVGGINTYTSANGGLTWTKVTRWSGSAVGIKTVHADKHWLAYNPLRPKCLFECNDGGIYRTYNPQSTSWNDITKGLAITQFYRNAVSNITNFAIGGAQDNGSKKILNGVATELTGGDGMNCEMDYSNANIFYTAIQYGTSLYRTTNGGNNTTNIQNNITDDPSGAWIIPYLIHPQFPDIIMAGYSNLYISYDRGNSWPTKSPTFGSNLTRLSMSPKSDERIWAVVGTSSIRYSANLGQTFNTVSQTFAGQISDIHADPWDSTQLYVTYSGYSATKVSLYNQSTGWTNISDSLPNVPVYCITKDTSNGTLYVGTAIGVFYRDTSMAYWQTYNNGMPSIEVTDLGINYTMKQIWASTYGRGMWKSISHETTKPVAGITISTIPFSDNVIALSPNPNSGNFRISSNPDLWRSNNVTVRIYSLNGQKVYEQSEKVNNGIIGVTANELRTGLYIVEVADEAGMVARQKFTVF